MGILDDAIREHLDLMRRLGAASDEVERLEKEAFGPPTRPGDPDFPQSDGATGDHAELTEQDPPSSGAGIGNAAQTSPPPVFDATTPGPVGSPGGEPPSAAEASPPAKEPVAESPPAGAPAAAAAPAATEPPASAGEPSAAEADVLDDLDLDLDLDLEVSDLDDEPEPLAGSGPSSEPPAPATEEQPLTGEIEPATAPAIESLDTDEHHFAGAIEDAEVVDDDPPASDPPAAEPASDDAEAEGENEVEEDVLEETPEFLRDAPEDDELWFEQGEPKDFDF